MGRHVSTARPSATPLDGGAVAALRPAARDSGKSSGRNKREANNEYHRLLLLSCSLRQSACKQSTVATVKAVMEPITMALLTGYEEATKASVAVEGATECVNSAPQ